MTLPTLTYKPNGTGVGVDLTKLIWSKLLIQAGSGYGKSWAVRQLCEETFGRVPHLILDPEGEFHTLREKFDYVLAAPKGGDVEASVKTAAVLARRLIELRASAVIDIFELKPAEQRRFVRIFLETLIALPRSLWHPTIVVLDEIQIFAPEKGHGESESLDAVADFGTRSRKRGFCLVGATTRLSKFHKDVAGNLNNKLIGYASLDVDIKRAANELGFDSDGRATINRLDPGQFYAYGPAISKDVTLVRTGSVKTTHPEAGTTVAVAAAPPSSRVKALIKSSLADLPKEAEEEARTVDDLRRVNADLTRKLRVAEKAAPAPVADERAITRAVDAALRQQASASARTVTMLRKALEAAMNFIINVSTANFDAAGVNKAELERAITAAVEKATTIVDQRLTARAKAIDTLRSQAQRIVTQLKAALGDDTVTIDIAVAKNEPFTVSGGPQRPAGATSRPRLPTTQRPPAEPVEGLSSAQQRILDALAGLESLGLTTANKSVVAVFADQSPTSSGYANNLGRLRSMGLLDYPSGGIVALTDAGRAGASGLEINSLSELHAAWQKQLPGAQWNIVAALIDAPDRTLARDDLAAASNQSPTSSGYANNLGRLRTLGLVEYKRGDEATLVYATDLLFPEGLT